MTCKLVISIYLPKTSDLIIQRTIFLFVCHYITCVGWDLKPEDELTLQSSWLKDGLLSFECNVEESGKYSMKVRTFLIIFSLWLIMLH